jgi:hypothetical protein
MPLSCFAGIPPTRNIIYAQNRIKMMTHNNTTATATMTKNPFLKRRDMHPPPLARENPFLTQPRYTKSSNQSNQNNNNLFLGFIKTTDTTATAAATAETTAPPLTFDEAFPSLAKSQQQSQQQRSPLNFKLAIQKNAVSEAPRSEATKSEAPRSEATKSEAPRSEAPRSEATKSEAPKPRSEATQFLHGNMFLFPQSRCVPHHHRDYDARDYYDDDDYDTPAYDSEYTQYYDHRR